MSAGGGMITLLIQGLTAVIQFISSMILARLLGPKDYGIMAMAATVVAFVGVFSSLGLLSSAVRSPTLNQTQQNNLFWIHVGLGMASAIAIILSTPIVVYIFKTPELMRVLIALSFIFVINNLSLQASTILVRELKFARQGMAMIAGVVVSVSVSIYLATNGLRYWSFVWGQIAGATTSSLLLFLFSTFRPGWPCRPWGVENILKLGTYNTAFELFNYFHRNLDNILIGRYCGAVPLGYYSRAYSLLMFPINNIRVPISFVAYPLMSRLQTSPKMLREYYLHITSLLALLSMPLIAFFFVASKPLIVLFYGEKWLAVSPIFSLLALAAFVQPVSGLANHLMVVLAQGRRNLQCGIFCALMFMLSFVIGLPWGPRGVALAYTVANYVVFFPWLYWAFLCSPITLLDFIKACRFAALTSIGAAGVSLCAGSLITDYTDIHHVVVYLFCFAAVFAGALRLTSAGKKQVVIWNELISHFDLRGRIGRTNHEKSNQEIEQTVNENPC